jgi:hypothetical protein
MKFETADMGARRHEPCGYRGDPYATVRTARGFLRGVERWGRRQAHWRCAEPVVILESDDWGLERRASSERLKAFGEPGEWADEEMETAEDMRRLFDVLARHRDVTGRLAVFSANFIVANPDHDAIARDRYEVYHEIPIGAREDLRAAYREGVERGVFCAELHGRRHFSVEEWLADLRSDAPGARQLSSEHRHGGLSLLKGQGWRYHTEYISWHTGVEPDEETLAGNLKDSLDILERLFGRRPSSTIAPHYVFSSRTEKAWRNAGLRFIQGSNYQILRGEDAGHGDVSVSHALGERSPSGLLYLRRSIKFEPRPERPHQGIAAALPGIRLCFNRKIPAVLDTHRINYTGQYSEKGLHDLSELLDALKPLQPRFLTTAELGEAIERGGPYQDTFTGMERSLTVFDPGWRRALRAAAGWRNARRATVAGERSESPGQRGTLN